MRSWKRSLEEYKERAPALAGRALFGFLYGERGYHRSLTIKLAPGERIRFHDRLKAAGHKYPFEFAITDQAIFFTREVHLRKESWEMKKVPLEMVEKVFLHRPRRASIICLSALIFLSGATMQFITMLNSMRHDPGTQTSYGPLYIMAVGMILPLLTRDRKVLVVKTKNRSFKWKPGMLTIDKQSQDDVAELQKNILNACRKAGIHVPEG